MSGDKARVEKNGYNFSERGFAGFAGVELVAAGRPRSNSVVEDFGSGRPRSNQMDYDPPVGRTRSTAVNEGYSEAVNRRKGILFYFRHLDIMGGPLGLSSIDSNTGQMRRFDRTMNVYNPVSTASAVNKSVKNASSGIKSLASSDDSGFSLLGELRRQILKALEEIGGNAYRAVAGVATKTMEFIEGSIDAILEQLLSSMVKLSVPIIGNAVRFAEAMYSGVKATYAWVSTQSIYEVLREGEPTMVVKSIHSRLEMEMGSKFGQALWQAAPAGSIFIENPRKLSA